MNRTVHPYPADYITARDLAIELGVTVSDVEDVVRRRYPHPPEPQLPYPPLDRATLIPGGLADFVRQELAL